MWDVEEGVSLFLSLKQNNNKQPNHALSQQQTTAVIESIQPCPPTSHKYACSVTLAVNRQGKQGRIGVCKSVRTHIIESNKTLNKPAHRGTTPSKSTLTKLPTTSTQHTYDMDDDDD